MRNSAHKIPTALRHGIYSTTTLLPGESQAAFDKLHREVIAEIVPKGVIEEDIVTTIARLMWRKNNLETLRIAKRAQDRLSTVLDEMIETKFPRQTDTHPETEKIIRAAEDKVRAEFGENYALVELGEVASIGNLAHDLDIEERFDSAIEKCLKRLLFVRGLKSLSGAPTSVPATRIVGPSKVA